MILPGFFRARTTGTPRWPRWTPQAEQIGMNATLADHRPSKAHAVTPRHAAAPMPSSKATARQGHAEPRQSPRIRSLPNRLPPSGCDDSLNRQPEAQNRRKPLQRKDLRRQIAAFCIKDRSKLRPAGHLGQAPQAIEDTAHRSAPFPAYANRHKPFGICHPAPPPQPLGPLSYQHLPLFSQKTSPPASRKRNPNEKTLRKRTGWPCKRPFTEGGGVGRVVG